MDADVAIVGAGPAGVAAAVHLRRAGRRVVVIDKATFPRDKICGDGLTTSALRELQALGVEPVDVDSWQGTDRIVVRSPSGYEATFPLPKGRGAYAAVATRRDLDDALVAAARRAGVEVREACALRGAATGATGVVLDTDAGELHARWAIGADGMWSGLRKALGPVVPSYRGEWHAFRQYFCNVAPAAATTLFVSFEADLLPGYFWSFPLADGRANVGYGIQRGHKLRTKEMTARWHDLLERPHIRAVLGPDAKAEDRHYAWPIPAAVDSVPSGRGRAVYVGDATAACDPMTGEGIGQALITGRLAAEAVHRHLDDPPAAQYAYRRALDAELVPDHRMSMLLVRALQHRKGARTAVRIAAATPWTRRNFARWLFEDEPRGVLLTPRRWHRDFLDRPGAF